MLIAEGNQASIASNWMVVDRSGKERGISEIAKTAGLTRQTVYRIKGDVAGAERQLGIWKS